MSLEGDVSGWIRQLQAGERAGVQNLWERYFQKLLPIARRKLGGLPRGAEDSEDVALSAFDSFIRGVEQGRFPKLEDRDDLWQLLVVLTQRKAVDRLVYEMRDKRDFRRLRADLDASASNGDLLRELIGREPDPAFAAEVGEEYQRLLKMLPDDECRRIAVSKMEGCTNEEVRERLGVALATVGRRLALIRKVWDHTVSTPCPLPGS
jgi:DNA-directed RNA polymerase specialized sigma24 family protein